jgi:hypothetical protein
MPVGDVGTTEAALPARGLTGDSGCETDPGAGEAERRPRAGDAGRANLERAGLPGLAVAAFNRATPAGAGPEAGAGSCLSCELLGPGTRRNRSSSCVLSLLERGPTRVQTFSPTKEYTSLEAH